jgi:hypothetical protein
MGYWTHTAETQCFEEPAEVILLDLDNTMLETVDAHTRILQTQSRSLRLVFVYFAWDVNDI